MAYPSARFWDKVADKYAAMPVRNAEVYAATLDQVRGLLSPDDAVLELGCGTGTTAVALAPSVNTYIATDVSEAMIEKGCAKAAEQGVSNLTFAVADAADAPEGPFDTVLAMNVLHLVDDLDAVMLDIARRTNPGGWFVSKTFCMPERRNLIWFFIHIGLPLMQLIGKAPSFAKLSNVELIQKMERAGFQIIEIEKAPGNDPRWTVVARRTQ